MNKALNKSLATFIIMLALVPSVHAQILLDDAVLVQTPSGSFGDYEFGLTRTTSFNGGDSSGLFGYGVELLNSNQLRFQAIGIAERNAIFPAIRGEVIDSAFASSNAPLADNTGAAPSGTLNISSGDIFLLGFYDDTSALFNGTDTPGPTDNYGWLEFRRTQNGIELLGAATAIGEGLSAGATTSSVPEPGSTPVLIAFGLLVALRRRAAYK